VLLCGLLCGRLSSLRRLAGGPEDANSALRKVLVDQALVSDIVPGMISVGGDFYVPQAVCCTAAVLSPQVLFTADVMIVNRSSSVLLGVCKDPVFNHGFWIGISIALRCWWTFSCSGLHRYIYSGFTRKRLDLVFLPLSSCCRGVSEWSPLTAPSPPLVNMYKIVSGETSAFSMCQGAEDQSLARFRDVGTI
jgi:hypothetical protein